MVTRKFKKYNSDEVRVVGHMNPDLDCVASSLSYCYLKNHLTHSERFVPYIGNEMTHQAKVILGNLGINPPEILETLKLQAEDIMKPAIWCISEESSILDALNKIKETSVRSMPVVNKEEELVGVFTESVVTDSIIQTFIGSISNIPVTINLVRKVLKATDIFIPEEMYTLTQRIITCALKKEKILELFQEGDIAIIGDREDIIDILLERNVALIILTKSSTLSDEVISHVKMTRTALISTPFDTFQTGKLISMAVPVKEFMINKPLFLRPENFENTARKTSLEAPYAVPVIDHRKRVIGVVSRTDIVKPRRKKVIMMDHNEKSQSIEGIEEADILEIIDHHRFAGLATDNPIHITTKPFGSTSTLIAEMFIEHKIDIPKNLALLMLSAICSDTLLFLSPTTTFKDQEIAFKLASIGGVQLDQFGREVLEAADVSAAMTPGQMLDNDRKEFIFNGKRIHIAQLETSSYKWLDKIKDKLLAAMEEMVSGLKVDGLLLMVTNITKKETRLLIKCNDLFYIEEIFGKTIQDDEILLPNVVSRKKQMVPLFGKG